MSRWKVMIAILFSLFCSQVGPLLSSSLFADDWKAGVARVKITPESPLPMAGYASRQAAHATGTLTDLWGKVLVLESPEGSRAVLITLDLCGVSRSLTHSLIARLQERHNWNRSQIAVCASHTHSGPVVGGYLAPLQSGFSAADQKLVSDYESWLIGQLVSAVDVARADLQPASMQWGSGTATFAVNRRNNREPEVPELRATGKLAGPHDHDVPVLLVKRNDQPAVIVFGYACHNTTLSGMQWSGDYAGYAQLELEKKFPDAVAMFWSGCGADQNPLPRRTVELAQGYGGQLATAVEQVVNGPLHPVKGELNTLYEEIPLPYAGLPTREKLTVDLYAKDPYRAATAQRLLEQFEANGGLQTTYPYPVGVWKLGDEVTWVFLGGEVVVDYALRLKSENPDRAGAFWVAGYANDVMAYIPSRRVLREGGYEGGAAMVYYGLPSPWGESVEDLILSAVQKWTEPAAAP